MKPPATKRLLLETGSPLRRQFLPKLSSLERLTTLITTKATTAIMTTMKQQPKTVKQLQQ